MTCSGQNKAIHQCSCPAAQRRLSPGDIPMTALASAAASSSPWPDLDLSESETVPYFQACARDLLMDDNRRLLVVRASLVISCNGKRSLSLSWSGFDEGQVRSIQGVLWCRACWRRRRSCQSFGGRLPCPPEGRVSQIITSRCWLPGVLTVTFSVSDLCSTCAGPVQLDKLQTQPDSEPVRVSVAGDFL